MDEADTPKKIVCESPSCFLCGLTLPSSKDRINVFGKSLFDIAGAINNVIAIDVTIYSSSDLFVCAKKCYKRLKKYDIIKTSLESFQNEIEEEF